jgi:GH15 family glucan-1,4-alpha-glucosidase
VKLHEAGHLRVPVSQFAGERDAIRGEIEARGYNDRLGTYVSTLDGDELDASLLALAIHGYADPAGARMRSTCDRLRERLGANNLMYRYVEDDGLPPGEGAFGICAFWEVQCRAMRGDRSAAVGQFEGLLHCANDVGLFAEETDPDTAAALGNFPQGLTHVGLIAAALSLQERQQ